MKMKQKKALNSSNAKSNLASLPGRLGGLGYTTWSQTADAAYLASYVHISHVFPGLFPSLSGAYPSVFSLASAADAAARSRPALSRSMP